MGFSPCRFTAASEATIMAAAPSLTPDALPAVMVPGWRANGLSLARPSSVVSGRRCSSLSTVTGPGLAARHDHRLDLFGEIAGGLRLGGTLLRAQAKASWSLRAT